MKLELLDNKHIQDVVWQLQRFVSNLAHYHTQVVELLKENKLFPIEVDLASSALEYDDIVMQVNIIGDLFSINEKLFIDSLTSFMEYFMQSTYEDEFEDVPSIPDDILIPEATLFNNTTEPCEDSILTQLKGLCFEEDEAIQKSPDESFADFVSFETQSPNDESDLLTGDITKSSCINKSECLSN